MRMTCLIKSLLTRMELPFQWFRPMITSWEVLDEREGEVCYQQGVLRMYTIAMHHNTTQQRRNRTTHRHFFTPSYNLPSPAFDGHRAVELFPASRPNTTASSNDDPPSRLRPCTPPIASPAANSPGMGVPSALRTRASSSTTIPPIVCVYEVE